MRYFLRLGLLYDSKYVARLDGKFNRCPFTKDRSPWFTPAVKGNKIRTGKRFFSSFATIQEGRSVVQLFVIRTIDFYIPVLSVFALYPVVSLPA